MLIHFVINPYDQNLNYQAICQELFGTSKCLAVLEPTKKGKVSPHVHIQGETEFAARTVDDKLAELVTKQHYKRKIEGSEKARVCKRVKREVTDTGFQYVCKDTQSQVLYKQGFTDIDLDALASKSKEHREHLKNDPAEWVWSKLDRFKALKDSPFTKVIGEEMIIEGKKAYGKYLRENKKPYPTSAQFRSRVYTYVSQWPNSWSALRHYCDITI